MTRLIVSALLLAAALASSGPALAQDDISVHVKYGDLNLASPAGAKAFHQRLEGAVTEICGRPDPHDAPYAAIINACRDRTWRDATLAERQAVAAAAAQKVQLASTRPETPAR